MTATIPTIEPDSIVAGDTLEFTRSLSDYRPADSWVLTYALSRTDTRIEITATDNGDGSHLVSELAATTAPWTVGRYRWDSYVTKAAVRHRIGNGRIEVLANLAALDSGYETRSVAEIIRDGLLGAVETGKKRVQISYSVGGRSRTYESRGELRDELRFWENKVRREVNKERAARGLGHSILVRL